MQDFFISYTHTDKDWAVWIAWQLEEAGHTTVIQAWDFHAGENFVSAMHKAASNAKHTIAVLSPAYLRSGLAESEWTAAFAADPTGKNGKLLPIKVRPVDVQGILGPIIHIDLTDLSEKAAIEELLQKIKASEDGVRGKPEVKPIFPGASSHNGNRSTILSDKENPKASIYVKENTPEFKAGLVDKDEQAAHILDHLDNQYVVTAETRNPLAYLLYGAATQWPEALLNILYVELKKKLKRPPPHDNEPVAPITKILTDRRIHRKNINPIDYFYEYLGLILNCDWNHIDIGKTLAKEEAPLFFYLKINSAESTNPTLVQGMLEAWLQIKLPLKSQRHMLILYYEYVAASKPRWSFLGKTEKNLIHHLQVALHREKGEKIFLPELKSPNKALVHDWIHIHIVEKIEDAKRYVETQIRQQFTQCKLERKDIHHIKLTDDDYEIHHHDLKPILIDALNQYG
jgi:hypothetical protein